MYYPPVVVDPPKLHFISFRFRSCCIQFFASFSISKLPICLEPTMRLRNWKETKEPTIEETLQDIHPRTLDARFHWYAQVRPPFSRPPFDTHIDINNLRRTAQQYGSMPPTKTATTASGGEASSFARAPPNTRRW